MHNIVLERLYLINLGRKQKNPSTLHHTVKAKFAEFEVIYCMGWLMWFGAKRHFLPGSIDAQYCSGAFIFNKSWQKTKKSFNSSPYRQGQICRIWSNILYGMTDVVWRKKTFSARFNRYIVLERLYLYLGRKQKNPSTLHHTVKAWSMGWLMWFGAKRLFSFFFSLWFGAKRHFSARFNRCTILFWSVYI